MVKRDLGFRFVKGETRWLIILGQRGTSNVMLRENGKLIIGVKLNKEKTRMLLRRAKLRKLV